MKSKFVVALLVIIAIIGIVARYRDFTRPTVHPRHTTETTTNRVDQPPSRGTVAPAVESDAADGPEKSRPAQEHFARATPLERMIKAGTVVDSRETKLDESGKVKRERLVRTDFKYPVLRVTEVVTKEGQVLSQQAMVADHILIRLREGVSEENLAGLLAKHGGRFGESCMRNAIIW